MKFVVAIDSSEQSETALDHAIDVAEGLNGSLTVAHAVDPSIYETPSSDPIADLSDAEEHLVMETIEDAEERGQRVLDSAVSRAADRDFEIRAELLHGDPVETITTYAEENDYDGLFIGHRDLTKDHEQILGSVAKGVIDRASIPVTVVR